jgi:hypothetical protein
MDIYIVVQWQIQLATALMAHAWGGRVGVAANGRWMYEWNKFVFKYHYKNGTLYAVSRIWQLPNDGIMIYITIWWWHNLRDILTRVLLYCHMIEWLQLGLGLVIRFIEHLKNVTTNNYDSLSELHIPKITVTTAHINSSWSSLAVAWWCLPMVDVSLTLDSQIVPGFSYHIHTSHKCKSQLNY